MRLTVQSEYSILCLKSLCEATEEQPLSAAEIARRENLPKDYVEQLLSRLRKAGLVKSLKGVRGGFVLAREPKDITLKDIIEAQEGRIYDAFCAPKFRDRMVCTHYDGRCSLRPIWSRLKEMIDDFFGKITLQTLLGQEDSVLKQLGTR